MSHPSTEILKRLREDLDQLVEAAANSPPSPRLRKVLDQEIRDVFARMEVFLRNLDPVRLPRFMFDPGDPAVVGRFVALATIAQPRAPLETLEPFYGSGVYAIYYTGDFEPYQHLSGSETPIYVGKADPQSDNAKNPMAQGDKLYGRLKDHRRNIGKATTTLRIEDFDYRSLVVQSGWQAAAEDYLIYLFKPVWNNETKICYGLGKHGDSPTTRINLRSPWDTLHPGRDWAHRDPSMQDARTRAQILSDLSRHFVSTKIYTDLDGVMHDFIEELRQL